MVITGTGGARTKFPNQSSRNGALSALISTLEIRKITRGQVWGVGRHKMFRCLLKILSKIYDLF